MISFDADERQLEAARHPFASPLIVIDGPAGTGKTQALLARAQRIAASLTSDQAVLLAAPDAIKLESLAHALPADFERAHVRTATLAEIAFETLVRHAIEHQEPEPGLIDDVRAAHLFEQAGAELFSLEWGEFVSAEIDPEIAGLRTPERFAAAAYRLIRKLRSAQIDPGEFRAICLRGTTSFYAHPPNFASPDLITGTGAAYRDSLRVDAAELARQREREIDLAKILARLYERYCERLRTQRCHTPADALDAGTHLLRADVSLAGAVKERYPYACIDDAQDLTGGELSFLEALYGGELRGVTLAGDAAQSTCTFAGARGQRTLAQAAVRFTLERQHRCAPAILQVARRVIDVRANGTAVPQAVSLYRATTVQDEADFVADNVAAAIAGGTAPQRIALIARSVRCMGDYLQALLARNVPLDIAGDANLYDFPVVQDALAALWSVADPYRHDWLLHTLEAPWLALSDASIALLCGEPSSPQAQLFELPGGESDPARARWDRHRDLRLGRNVTRGDRDADLPAETRERIVAFRAARERWEAFERKLDLVELARLIVGETVLATRSEGDGAQRFNDALIARLIDDVAAFTAREPLGSLHDYLHYVERVAETDEDLLTLRPRRTDSVSVLSVEAAKGRQFEDVFLVDARASGFPRYYVPDAFLFYPSLGIIAKENVGEGARSARTAKFTYAMYKFKTRERYVEEERRAFACAATRASERLWISASGRPTRGAAAPELLEELRGAGLPGVRDVTHTWRPTRARVTAAIFSN
ncbi:MAG TPA: ATP-dependent helicase [Candidatus Acidoferrales bacterium]|nr:ATP-dependent helicase [Candidatus Acidoferrales bacterium]